LYEKRKQDLDHELCKIVQLSFVSLLEVSRSLQINRSELSLCFVVGKLLCEFNFLCVLSLQVSPSLQINRSESAKFSNKTKEQCGYWLVMQANDAEMFVDM